MAIACQLLVYTGVRPIGLSGSALPTLTCRISGHKHSQFYLEILGIQPGNLLHAKQMLNHGLQWHGNVELTTWGWVCLPQLNPKAFLTAVMCRTHHEKSIIDSFDLRNWHSYRCYIIFLPHL